MRYSGKPPRASLRASENNRSATSGLSSARFFPLGSGATQVIQERAGAVHLGIEPQLRASKPPSHDPEQRSRPARTARPWPGRTPPQRSQAPSRRCRCAAQYCLTSPRGSLLTQHQRDFEHRRIVRVCKQAKDAPPGVLRLLWHSYSRVSDRVRGVFDWRIVVRVRRVPV